MQNVRRLTRDLRLATTLLAVSLLTGCASFERCGPQGCAGDREITARVQAVFDRSPALEGVNRVSIQTVNHVVYLRGIVDTPYQQQLAASLAGQVDGVNRVVNLIGLDNNSM
jgi:osmotically-inducible protein OsmY